MGVVSVRFAVELCNNLGVDQNIDKMYETFDKKVEVI